MKIKTNIITFLSLLVCLTPVLAKDGSCGCDKDDSGDTDLDISTSSCVQGTVTTAITLDTANSGGYTPTLPNPQNPGIRTVSGLASNVLSYTQNRATVRLRAGQQYKVTYSLYPGSSAGSLHTKIFAKNLPSGYRIQMQVPGTSDWKDQAQVDQGNLTSAMFPVVHRLRVVAPAQVAGAIPTVSMTLPKFKTVPNPSPNGFGVLLVEESDSTWPAFERPRAGVSIPLGTTSENGDAIGAGTLGFAKELRDTGVGKPPFLVDPSQLVYSGPAIFDGVGNSPIGIKLIRNGNNISQLRTDDILADVLVHNSTKFEIRLFPPSQVGTQPAAGQPFPLSGTPLSSCLFEKIGQSTLRIARYDGTTLISDETFVGNYVNNLFTQYSVTRTNGPETTTVTDNIKYYSNPGPNPTIEIGPHYSFLMPVQPVSSPQSGNLFFRDETTVVTRDGVAVSRTENRYLGHSVGGWGNSSSGGIGDFLITSKKFFGTGSTDFLLSGTWPNILLNSPFNVAGTPEFWAAHGKPAFTFEADGSWTRYQYNRSGEVIKTFRDYRGTPVTPATATDANSVTELITMKGNPYGASPGGTGPLAEVVKELPGDSEIRTQNKLSSKTTNTYTAITEAGNQVIRRVNARYVENNPATAILETTDTYHSSAPVHLRRKMLRRLMPTGETTTYAYEKGVFDMVTRLFTPAANGSFIRATVTQGTSATPAGIANQTTRNCTVTSEEGMELQSTLQIHTGGTAYSTASITEHFYNASGDRIRTERDGRIISENSRTGFTSVSSDEIGIIYTTVRDTLGRITSRAKASGPTTAYTNSGRTTTRTTATADGTQVAVSVVDLLGRPTSETSIDGQTVTYAYPSSGKQRVITYPGGLKVTETNQTGGEPIHIVNSVGTKIVPTYYTIAVGADGRTTTQVNVNSPASTRVTTTVTDWLGRTVSETFPNPAGGTALTTTTSYFSNGLPAARTFAATTLIKPYRYQYDSLGRIFRQGTDLNSNALLDLASEEPVSEFAYGYESIGGYWFDVAESRIYRSDGSAVPATASIRKTMLSATDLDGYASREITTGSNGLVTDTRGSIIRVIGLSSFNSQRSDRDSLDNTNYTNGLKQTDIGSDSYNYYTYDALERLKTDTNYNGITTTKYAYDPVSKQVSSVTDGLGNVTSYAYYPPTHANAGLLQTKTDALLKLAHRSYNDQGQLVREWGASTYPTERVYTPYGQLNFLKTFRAGTGWANATWPSGSEGAVDLTTWTFTEATGLLANKKDNLNRQITYTYHPNGQVATRVNSRSITTTYGGFDGLGLPTTTTYSDGTPALTFARTRDVSLKTLTDAAGAHTRTYYASGLPYQITTTAGLLSGVAHTYTQESAGSTRIYAATKSGTPLVSQTDGYEEIMHRLSSVTSGAHTTEYTYLNNNSGRAERTDQSYLGNYTLTHFRSSDQLSRLISTESYQYAAGDFLELPTASHSTELYDALHRRKIVKSQDSTTWEYTYNDRSELLTGVRKLPTAQPLAGQQYAYTYDNLGNTTQKQTGGDSAGANLRSQTSSPNSLNQYASYQTPGSFDVLGQASAGSTVTVNGTAATFQDTYFRANVTTANSGANGIWQSVAITNNGVTTTGNLYVPPAAFTPTYDLDGNLTDDGEWTYLWDAENRMKTATRATRAVTAGAPYRRFEHTYDAFSRLFQTRTFATATGTIPLKTEQYIYSGWNRTAMLESAGTATPVLRQSYIWGLDISAQSGQSGQDSGGVGALLAVIDTASGTHYPCYDSNGNITTLVNAATGAISAQYEYSPFGETTRATGPFAEANPYRFSTKPTNSETGLLYYGYRFYKPKWQTWPSRDPIEEEGGVNLYGFVGNDGVNQWDYLGMADSGSPGIGDQINPFGLRGDGQKDYKGYFDGRFPKAVAGAKELLKKRIKESICKGVDSDRPKQVKVQDVDISPNGKRFGDVAQNFYERKFQIGYFEIKAEPADITWLSRCSYSYKSIAYIEETTGANPLYDMKGIADVAAVTNGFWQRKVRMAEWDISDNGVCPKCCDDAFRTKLPKYSDK